MANNRRSGNSGDMAAYGNDTAELLNKESAQLLADSMRSDNPEKPQRRGRKSKSDVKETVKFTDAPKKRSQKTKHEAGDTGAVEGKSEKSTRRTKLITEKTAAELTADIPRKRAGKSNPDSGEAEVAEGRAENRARKSKAVTGEATEPADERESEQDDETGRVGCKTPQVMKLIEGDSDNLVIFAGKSRVPSLLRGRESLSAMMRRNAAGSPVYDDTEVVNITELVIRHEAAEILDRFNACSCEKCVSVFSEMIAKRIPVRYARISRAELDSGELPERAVSMRQVVLPEMIRQLICNKKRCFHDE